MESEQLAFRTTLAVLEREVQGFVCPIFGVRGTVGKPIGSGFLLKVAERMFLVTAAHVLADRHVCTLQIPGETRIVPFAGTMYSTERRPSNQQLEFGLDLAFVDLDISAMPERPSTRALALEDLDPSDVPAAQTAYGCVGFPSSENQSVPGQRFQMNSFFFGGQAANPPKYEILTYDPKSHFIVTFERDRMLDPDLKEVQAPIPLGMSGGPVFKLGSFSEIAAGVAHPSVIALTTEWAPVLKVMVGVRISLVLDLMRQLIPGLGAHIPPTKYVRGIPQVGPA